MDAVLFKINTFTNFWNKKLKIYIRCVNTEHIIPAQNQKWYLLFV